MDIRHALKAKSTINSQLVWTTVQKFIRAGTVVEKEMESGGYILRRYWLKEARP